MSKQYQFTIVNGALTAIYELDDGVWKLKSPDADETWSVSGSQVTKAETKTEGGKTVVETSIYADQNGDGIFLRIAETQTIDGALVPDDRGGRSNDRYHGSDSDDRYHGGGGNDSISGGRGLDDLRGEQGNDSISGGLDDDLLDGGVGNDKLYGDSGNDDLYGGAGNDHLFGGLDDDYLEGGSGNDRLNGDDGDDSVYGDDGNDQVAGGLGNDDLYGGRGNDQLRGDAGDDSLHGGTGNDKLDGGAGSDTVSYDDAASGVTVDLLKGKASGSAIGKDGLTSIENVEGSSFADTLTGNGGNNILAGGDGGDTLFGGAGSDTFVFDNLAVGGPDTIRDFTAGQDKLAFDDSVFTSLTPGVDVSNTADGPVAAGSNLIFDNATGSLYYDGDGYGGGTEAVLVGTLNNVSHLQASDIVIV